MGDASTKFFHANARIKFRRNLITQLVDDLGDSFSRHKDKAAVIWNSFKDPLGKSEFNSILFDLNQYFAAQTDFSQLVEPVEKAKIDQVAKQLPSDKAPGPDGFKKYWPIICDDFYLLCQAFYDENICFRVSMGHSSP